MFFNRKKRTTAAVALVLFGGMITWWCSSFTRLENLRAPIAGKAYGVAFIPSAFLVDGKGKIVALGEDCRGLKLHVSLDNLKK